MRDAYPRLRALGVEVGAVTFGGIERMTGFCRDQKAPFACYADPERRAYDAFGLERRPGLHRFLNVRQLPALVRALRAGHRIYRSELSARQLPGVFLIDSGGEIRYAHRNRFPADNPRLEDLLAAAAGLRLRSRA